MFLFLFLLLMSLSSFSDLASCDWELTLAFLEDGLNTEVDPVAWRSAIKVEVQCHIMVSGPRPCAIPK